MTEKVLIIDDDAKLLKLLREYFEGNNFKVLTLSDDTEVLSTLKSESPEIVILDVMLPGKDGLEILREIRKEYDLPIIMLTAKGEDTDRIVGLELGADDYLPKPFNPRELLARMKAVLRRYSVDNRNEKGTKEDIYIKSGDITLNTAAQVLLINDNEIELSTTEFKLLQVLMKNPNTVLSRDQLMNLARGKDFMAFDRSIDVHISKLRTKIETDPRSPKYIKTVWGTGYMFVET
ncbi:response regulator [Thermodesulfobacteriota bacterium]